MHSNHSFGAISRLTLLISPADSAGKTLRKRSPKNSRVFPSSAMAGLAALMMSGSAYGQFGFVGTWENFTVISGAGVTNTGPTVIDGNIALSPLISLTGFPPGVIVNGTVYFNDSIAMQAKADSRTAFETLRDTIFPNTMDLTGQTLGLGGAATLSPGAYRFSSSAALSGTLTLNADVPDAVFIFQIGSELITGSGSQVIITGAGAESATVFWQVGTSATLGAGTAFTGNILAGAAITFVTGSSLVNGRAVALEESVTFDTNQVSSGSFFGSGSGPGSFITVSFLDLAPDELTAIFQMGFSAAEAQNLNIQRHLESVRRGGEGSPTPSRFVPVPGSKSGLNDSKGGLMEQTMATRYDRPWSVFFEATDASASVDDSSNASGYDFDTRGATLGVDRRVNDNFVFGVLGSYNSLEAQLFNGGSIDGESFKGAIYATLFRDGFFLDALIGAGFNSYETSRSSLLGFAEGSPDAWELNTLINGGYDIRRGSWTITPMASASYTRVNLDSFTETGSLSPLSFPEQHQDSLRTDLGVKISYSGTLDNGMVITPQVRLAWQHEFLDSTQSMDSTFVSGAGSTFTVNGPHMKRDRAMLSAGINVQITPAVNAYAYYDGQLGSSNHNSNSVTVGVMIEF